MELELENWELKLLLAAWESVDERRLSYIVPQASPAAAPRSESAAKVYDLPVEEANTATVTHLIDVLTDYDQPIDIAAVQDLLCKKDYASLPAPFNAVEDYDGSGYTMDIVAGEQDNGKWTIVKWLEFTSPEKTSKVKTQLCHGKAFQLCKTKFVYRATKCLHELMMQMHGAKVMNHGWQESQKGKGSGKAADTLTQSQRAAGYVFIREKGPRANNSNPFMEWADAQVHDDSPPPRRKDLQYFNTYL
jgi:hypothetical protein